MKKLIFLLTMFVAVSAFANGKVTSITLAPTSATITAGSTQSFVATAHYNNGTTKDITSSAAWASTNTSVATAAGGVATGVSAGTANIKASQAGVTGSATLTVTAKLAVLNSITVAPTNASVLIGVTQQFVATGHYSDGSTKNITATSVWGSSDAAIATVDQGLATGVSVGTVTVTASQTGVAGSAVITVTAPLPVVNLTWTASTDVVVGYNMYRSPTSGGAYSKINTVLIAGTAYTDSSVTHGQTWFYVATAVAANGAESVYSNEATTTVP